MSSRLGGGPERGADVVVAEVVAVAEEDGGALFVGQLRRQLPQLFVLERLVDRVDLGQLRRACPLPAQGIERDIPCYRERPRSQMLTVLQPRVCAQRAQEGLLEGIVRGVPTEHPTQLGEHEALLLLVEPLERRDRHDFHHRFKRGCPANCEMWAAGVAKWEIVV